MGAHPSAFCCVIKFTQLGVAYYSNTMANSDECSLANMEVMLTLAEQITPPEALTDNARFGANIYIYISWL